MPRRGVLVAARSATKRCQAGMMRAGFAPTSDMSANTTCAASAPSASRSRSILRAETTTSVGSSASTPARTKLDVSVTNSSSPEYSNASWRKGSAGTPSHRTAVRRTRSAAFQNAPPGQQLPLALTCQRGPLLDRRPRPGERVDGSLLDGAEPQPGGKRATCVGLQEPGVLGAWQPERQLHPWLHPRGDERLAVEPVPAAARAHCGRDAIHDLRHGRRLSRPGCIHRPAFCETEHPTREIAR